MKLIAELSDLSSSGDVEADDALEHKGHGRAGQVGVHVLLPLGRDLLRDSLPLPAADAGQYTMHGSDARVTPLTSPLGGPRLGASSAVA